MNTCLLYVGHMSIITYERITTQFVVLKYCVLKYMIFQCYFITLYYNNNIQHIPSSFKRTLHVLLLRCALNIR